LIPIGLIQNILLWFGLYLIVSLSLNMEYGYGGIPNFGKAISVIVGAVVAGGIMTRILMAIYGVKGGIGGFSTATSVVSDKVTAMIQQNPLFGLALFLATIALAVIIGCIVGALFILPSARLREDYLAITLLAISETFTMICYYDQPIIGGYYGVSVPDILGFLQGSNRFLFFTAIILVIAFLTYLFFERLLNTPYGRLLRAMRENEDVIRVYGRDIMKVRMMTMAVGSGVAAIVGVLLSYFTLSVQANSFMITGRTLWTFYPFLIILLGGAGNNRGVVAGTFIFVTVMELIDFYKSSIVAMLNLPVEAVWLEYILFGVMMLLILYYKPEGLIPEKPIITEPIKKAYKTRKVAVRGVRKEE